jgi:putative FmdB family regulatory protein
VPTYEYECQSCDHSFERFQSMTDKPLQRCPECRCKVKRLIGTGAGIIFKGSGFYETDYRSKSYQQGAKKESTKKESAATSSAKDSSADKSSAKSPKKKSTAKKSD